jgi:hypothetical protein
MSTLPWRWPKLTVVKDLRELARYLNNNLTKLSDHLATTGPAADLGWAIVDPTDGATAVQDAINSLNAGVVYLKPGKFDYAATLLAKKQVSMMGSGRGVSILNYQGAAEGLKLPGTGLDYWGNRFADFTLQTPAAGVGLPYFGTYGVTVDDAVITDWDRVEITGWATAGLLLRGVVNCLSHTFGSVDIHENNNGVRTGGGNTIVNHINFGKGCRIRASQQWNLYNDLDVRNWKLAGVDFEAGVLGAIWMNQFYGLSIDTCYFEQINGAPMVVLADTGAGAGADVRGNQFQGFGAGAGGTAVKLGASGGTVAGSVVDNWFSALLVGINRAGLEAGGDYTTGNKYTAVTTPTV